MKSAAVFVFLAIQMIASQETGVTPTPSPVTPTVKIPDPSPVTPSVEIPDPSPVTPPVKIPDPSPITQAPVDPPKPTPDPVNPPTVDPPVEPPTDPAQPRTDPPKPITDPANPDPSKTTPKPQLTTLYILYELIQSSLTNNRVDSKCVQALPDKDLANKIQNTLELCMYEGRQPDRRLVAKLAWEEEKHRQDLRGIYSEFIGIQRWIHEAAENVRFEAVKAAIMAEMVRSRLDPARVERITKECAREKLQDELESSNANLGPIRDCLNNKIF